MDASPSVRSRHPDGCHESLDDHYDCTEVTVDAWSVAQQ